MSGEAVYKWQAPDTSAICTAQTTAGAASLKIDGYLSQVNPITGTNSRVELGNISRIVSITSALGGPNTSALSFTVAGTDYNNVPLTETLAGPNTNATVQTTGAFRTVTSVSVNGAVTGTGVSVGIGNGGKTEWFWVDRHASVENLGLQAVITGTVTYSFEATMDDVNQLIKIGLTPTAFNPITAMTSATTNQLAATTQPLRFCRFSVSGATGSAVFRILQQGIR